MNPPISELDLQRCADGELSAADLRVLLARLDETPAGWKSLALAFLENQSFDAGSTEFRSGAAAAPQLVASSSSAISSRPRVAAIRWASLAASLAIAFWFGTRTGGTVDPSAAPNNPAGIASSAPRPTPTFASDAADRHSQLASAGTVRPGPQPTAVLKLPFASGDDEALAIPVYDQVALAQTDSELPLWPRFEPASAPSEPGYRMTTETNLVSFPLDNGDTVYVPVEVRNVSYAVQ